MDAFSKGAKGCIINDIDNVTALDDKFIIVVKDTIKTLETLAILKRNMYEIPVIAVTGSYGKTSTKDVIYSVLRKKYNVLKTEGNYNSNIGLSLTILNLKDEEMLVLEMGMSELGEISILSNIARPTIGVITNVGTAHIGNLGSRENILKAKLEIIDGLDGVLLINNDNDLLNKWNNDNKFDYVKTIGINNNSNLIAKNVVVNETNIEFECDGNKYEITNGEKGYVYNALFSIYIGNLFNISYEDIYDGIKNYNITSGRNEIIKINDYILINDCYNASLESVKGAINNLKRYKNRTIIVLGDLLELGSFSKQIHKEIGIEIKNSDIDVVITVGEETKVINDIIDNKNNAHFDNNKDAIDYLKNIIKKGDVILVKASNGMNFKEIIENLKIILK